MPSTSSPRISGTHMTLRMACATIDSCAEKWRSDKVSSDRIARFLCSTSSMMVCDMRTCCGSSMVPSRRLAATGTGASRWCSRNKMKARSASGNSSKMKFMIFSISIARSVTAPSAMLACAIACSRCTVFSRSLRSAWLVSASAGVKRVASTELVISVGMLPRSGTTSEWNTSGTDASASSSPSCSTCQAPGARRSPSTKVPLLECRSST